MLCSFGGAIHHVKMACFGFELPPEKSVVGPNGPKIGNEVVLEMAASV
jgi:hypothetical protein